MREAFKLLFSNGGELYWPHEALKTCYTTAGFLCTNMSHSDFMDWILELQKMTCLRLPCSKIIYLLRILGCAGLDGSCAWPILVLRLNM